MIMDDNLIFSDAQVPPTPLSGDFTSTDSIDTEVASSNLGAGTPIWVIVKMNDIQIGTTAETLQIDVTDCTATSGTYAAIIMGRIFTGGEFVKAPTLLAAPLPADHRRYLQINYSGNTGLVWTGTVDAYLSLNAPKTVDGLRI